MSSMIDHNFKIISISIRDISSMKGMTMGVKSFYEKIMDG